MHRPLQPLPVPTLPPLPLHVVHGTILLCGWCSAAWVGVRGTALAAAESGTQARYSYGMIGVFVRCCRNLGRFPGCTILATRVIGTPSTRNPPFTQKMADFEAPIASLKAIEN